MSTYDIACPTCRHLVRDSMICAQAAAEQRDRAYEMVEAARAERDRYRDELIELQERLDEKC